MCFSKPSQGVLDSKRILSVEEGGEESSEAESWPAYSCQSGLQSLDGGGGVVTAWGMESVGIGSIGRWCLFGAGRQGM